MDSPGAYPESPLENDDVVYPCKGCGEILEEGKAFELAGNRWHIDCFRCNTCGTLLDSDANLLLLGDGSLICNNCTYSCNHCGNKIEDLAILTGDQAFCANCFRCRNCKRKIENLRYARTSQGIFCMSCHESLMARRRKKSKKPPSTVPKVDKSLPALPPSAAPTFTPDLDTPSEVFSEPTTTDVSPRPQHPARTDSSPATFRRDASPASLDSNRKDNHTLPASTYKDTNPSEASDAGGDDGVFLPIALDPNMAPGPSPLGKSSKANVQASEANQAKTVDGKPSRDYFNRPSGSHRDLLKENRSRSASAERGSHNASPHIAFQERGRQPSETAIDTLRKRKESAFESPSASTDQTRSTHASPARSQSSEAFKLQDVPKNKKAEARKNSKADVHSPSRNSPAMNASRLASPPYSSPATGSPMPSLNTQVAPDESPITSGSSYSSTQRVERPARGDSLNSSVIKPAATKKDPSTPFIGLPDRSQIRPSTNGAHSAISGTESPAATKLADPPLPPRSAGRPPPPAADTFVSPRAPPQPPPPQHHKTSESISTLRSEDSQVVMSPAGLPRYSAQGDFSMDEDFARLIGGHDNHEKEGGVLRRVSNAVSKHGRSFSDRGSITTSKGHKKWPTNGSIDISSPTIASPDSREESVNLRNELKRAQQKIAELEAEKNGLRESVHSVADLKQASTMLREKRNTMAILDSQREIVVRELEIMTEHLKRAKDNSNTMDIDQLKSDIMKDFANSLHRLKDNLGSQIEDLIAKRLELTEEIANLIQMKDKGFQEYESLSAQNTKLANMNRDLVESIQRTLKDNKQHQNGNHALDARSPANGLGIYHSSHKSGKSEISLDAPGLPHESSYANLHETEPEPIVAQPHVVSIRKGAKANKFNWKKGGQAITKNVTKGFKGAFGPSDARREDEYSGVKVIGTPYGSTHSQPDFASMTSSLKSKEDSLQPTPRGWFGGKTGATRPQLKNYQSNSSSNNLAGDDGSVLFGSDLSARIDFEKTTIPALVIHCINEVESRGMDVEGIYRKSGGTGQVNQVKSGFENSNDYDLSDPDLDIHAVTSCLKGYLRKLPQPLITIEVYDPFLQAGQLTDSSAQAKAFTAAINELPVAHRDLLQYLVLHLSKVMRYVDVNKMTSLNLAVVFAPTIMRSADLRSELNDQPLQQKAVQMLLDNYKAIYANDMM